MTETMRWKWVRLCHGDGSSTRWIRVRDYDAEADDEEETDDEDE